MRPVLRLVYGYCYSFVDASFHFCLSFRNVFWSKGPLLKKTNTISEYPDWRVLTGSTLKFVRKLNVTERSYKRPTDLVIGHLQSEVFSVIMSFNPFHTNGNFPNVMVGLLI